MKGLLLVIALMVFAAAGALVPRGGAASARALPTATPLAGDGPEAVREYLLTSAASDFRKHQSPPPVRFRKVRFGHLGDTSRSGSYRICGQFATTEKGGGKTEWIDFATIKTSGYEQYIGKTTYCTDSKITWLKTGDLAPSLKMRLDALK